MSCVKLLKKKNWKHLLNTLNFESFFLLKRNIITYVSMSVSVYKVTSHHSNSPVSAVWELHTGTGSLSILVARLRAKVSLIFSTCFGRNEGNSWAEKTPTCLLVTTTSTAFHRHCCRCEAGFESEHVSFRHLWVKLADSPKVTLFLLSVALLYL